MSYQHLLVKKSELEIQKKQMPKIEVHSKSISCPDALADLKNATHYQQKHPRVMIELDENDDEGKACHYCGVVYVYKSS